MESTDNVNNLSNSAEETSVFTGRMLANYWFGYNTCISHYVRASISSNGLLETQMESKSHLSQWKATCV